MNGPKPLGGRLADRAILPFIAALTIGITAFALPGCGDDAAGGTDEPTLAEEMIEAGLPPGNYRVESGGNSVCIRVFNAPGGVRSTESISLAGFETFELVHSESETLSIEGTADTLHVRWTTDNCVEWDVDVDQVTNVEPCGEDDCPPFDMVRVCANDGSPTFFASVDECGQSTFPAVQQ